MDLETFIEKLYKAGWIARGDAQHDNIEKLWQELIDHGLIVHRDGSPCKKCEVGVRR